jgi:hypothetical protein
MNPGASLGGPGSAPWSFGPNVPTPTPTPSPSPIPPPSCLEASIFADCFGACNGTIDGADPGPVCGWTFIEPFGALGGEFNFTPGVMSMDTAGVNQFPIATKPLPSPLASVFNVSGRWSFTEYATVPNANTTYQILVNNTGLTESLFVSLYGDGNIAVQAGDSNNIPTYLGVGTWTPTPGASHVVHFEIDGAGAPTLYLDGVLVPLTFIGDIFSFSVLYPAEAVSYGGGAASANPAESPVESIFITAGIVGPDTVFCCP